MEKEKLYNIYLKSLAEGKYHLLNYYCNGHNFCCEDNDVRTIVIFYEDKLIRFDESLKNSFSYDYEISEERMGIYKNVKDSLVDEFFSKNNISFDEWVKKYLH